MHYLTHGRYEGRNPHPLFDTAFYLEQNLDVAAAEIDPLVHYLTHGAAEGRRPHPLFDGPFYLAQNTDVAEAGIDPLTHYLTHGAAEGRTPHPLFDNAFYLAKASDLTSNGVNPLRIPIVASIVTRTGGAKKISTEAPSAAMQPTAVAGEERPAFGTTPAVEEVRVLRGTGGVLEVAWDMPKIEPVAWVVAGLRIDDAMAQEMRRMTGLDVTFLSRPEDGDWQARARSKRNQGPRGDPRSRPEGGNAVGLRQQIQTQPGGEEVGCADQQAQPH